MNKQTKYFKVQRVQSFNETGGRSLCKKPNMSTFSGFSFDLFLVTIFPATEQILSEGTDVPGMQNSFLAKFESTGNVLHSFSTTLMDQNCGPGLVFG